MDAAEGEERQGRRLARTRPGSSPRVGETPIEIPAIANGRILPGDVDRFRFRATQGQRIVAAVSARELIPYLADAVPGWFQATIALRDASGNEIAYMDDYRFHPDPVLVCEIPADGEYVVEIRDALYRGREDFVYRIVVGELPFVTSVFPLGGPVGIEARVQLRGVNLAARELLLPAQDSAGLGPIRAPGNELIASAIPFVWGILPECLEREPNQDPTSALDIALPCIINGRVYRPGDVDVFRFKGRYGHEIVAQVSARCLQSPLDSVLSLRDESGRVVAFSDDCVDAAAGRTTHHADSYLRVKLPRTGTYFLYLSDAQQKGGPEYGYRLRVGGPQPDFDLRIVPSCINASAGATVPVEVHAVRRDGFDGPIHLALSGAPEGFELGGAVVPAGQDRVRIVLTVPNEPLDRPIGLSLIGRARAGKREISRPVVAADDVMQAVLWRHLVPAEELLVSIRGRSSLRIRARRHKTVVLPVGGSMLLKLPLTSRRENRWAAKNKVQLELDAPPPGIEIQKVTRSDSGFEIRLRTDGKKIEPGSAGNLIFTARATPARRVRPSAPAVLAAVPYRVVNKRGARR